MLSIFDLKFDPYMTSTGVTFHPYNFCADITPYDTVLEL